MGPGELPLAIGGAGAVDERTHRRGRHRRTAGGVDGHAIRQRGRVSTQRQAGGVELLSEQSAGAHKQEVGWRSEDGGEIDVDQASPLGAVKCGDATPRMAGSATK